MSAHTPGPWTLTHPGRLLFVIDAGPIHIADAFAKVDGGTSERYVLQPEAEANARLIAAAPELLAALRDLMKSCENWAPTIDRSRAREAIAKAEGAL